MGWSLATGGAVVLAWLCCWCHLVSAASGRDGIRHGSLVRLPVRRRELVNVTAAQVTSMREVRRLRRNRRRRMNEVPFDEVPTFGSFEDLGYYYVDLFVGTPPQKATVIFDTGSGLTAFPCTGCRDCGTHIDPVFDTGKSSTALALNRPYSISYTEGSSLSGRLFQDTVWLGFGDGRFADDGAKFGVDFKFGCHTHEGGLFRTQLADGIMGASARASHGTDLFVEALYNENKIKDKVFSLCLHTDGGVLAMGGYDVGLHTAPVQFTGFSGSSWYTVTATGWRVGGSSIGASSYETNRGGIILDSGTTYTYINTAVFRKIKSSVTAWCATSPTARCRSSGAVDIGEGTLCWNVPKDTEAAMIASFPPLSLALSDDITLTWPPEQYLWRVQSRSFCLGLYDNGYSETVIGGNLMQNHNYIFDLTNRKIGIAKANCAATNITPPPAPTTTTSPQPTTTTTTTTTKAAAAPTPAEPRLLPSPAPAPTPAVPAAPAAGEGSTVALLVTDKQRVYRSTDEAGSWVALRNLDGVTQVLQSPVQPDDTAVLVKASSAEILITRDAGASFRSATLVHPALLEGGRDDPKRNATLTIDRVVLHPTQPEMVLVSAWTAPCETGQFGGSGGGGSASFGSASFCTRYLFSSVTLGSTAWHDGQWTALQNQVFDFDWGSRVVAMGAGGVSAMAAGQASSAAGGLPGTGASATGSVTDHTIVATRLMAPEPPAGLALRCACLDHRVSLVRSDDLFASGGGVVVDAGVNHFVLSGGFAVAVAAVLPAAPDDTKRAEGGGGDTSGSGSQCCQVGKDRAAWMKPAVPNGFTLGTNASDPGTCFSCLSTSGDQGKFCCHPKNEGSSTALDVVASLRVSPGNGLLGGFHDVESTRPVSHDGGASYTDATFTSIAPTAGVNPEGSLLPCPDICFPATATIDLLDTTLGRIFLYVADAAAGDGGGASGGNRGNIYVSDSQGVRYSLSLEGLRLDPGGGADFVALRSLQGVYLANTLAGESPDGTSRVETRITFNGGGGWERLRPPALDSTGRPVSCGGSKRCALHLLLGMRRGAGADLTSFFSDPSAAGVAMALGSIGASLAEEDDAALNVYLTRDAGLSWREVAQGAHIFRFSDHGTLVIMAPVGRPTTEAKLSIDGGTTFRAFTFADTPVEVDDIRAQPSHPRSGPSRTFLIFGSVNDVVTHRPVGLTFRVRVTTAAQPLECAGIATPGTPGSDFETWSPSDHLPGPSSATTTGSSSAAGCFLGHTVQFTRRKEGAACFVRQSTEPKVFKNSCVCAPSDFECGMGFVRASWETAVAQGAAEGFLPCILDRRGLDVSLCTTGQGSVTMKPYRRIVGDSCVGGWLPPTVEFPCPSTGDGSTGSGLQSQPLVIGLSIAGAALVLLAIFCVCCRRRCCSKGFVRYSSFNMSSAGVTDTTDGAAAPHKFRG